MEIKMYRHTVKHREYIGDDDYIDTYFQTEWGSVAKYIPSFGREVVLVEEKIVKL